jgi:CheY-like chemotaxis protein
VRRHQSRGQVHINSVERVGTTVMVYLPRYQGLETQAAKPDAKAMLSQAKAGETVLVVDDEPVVRALIVEVLQDLGYITIEAADGRSGLRQVETDRRIDLMVTDIGLPNGMNGRQLAEAARARCPALKVLFITGFAESAAVGNGVMQPGTDIMIKPFSLDTLADRVRTMISTQPGSLIGP